MVALLIIMGVVLLSGLLLLGPKLVLGGFLVFIAFAGFLAFDIALQFTQNDIQDPTGIWILKHNLLIVAAAIVGLFAGLGLMALGFVKKYKE